MNVEWVEGEIAGGKGVFGILDTGLKIAIYRHRDGTVWFSAALPASSLTFDRTRMPILWIDNSLICDAGKIAEMSRLAERDYSGGLDNFMPFHMVGDSVIGFHLWHGDEAKGLGCVSQLLVGGRLSIRYFVLPHDSIDVIVGLAGMPPLLRNALELKLV
ncbi:MAG: hypothetical protein WCK65_07205 [Rhodospirillaceae bacterium]